MIHIWRLQIFGVYVKCAFPAGVISIFFREYVHNSLFNIDKIKVDFTVDVLAAR